MNRFVIMVFILLGLQAVSLAQIPANFDKENYIEANKKVLYNKYLETPFSEKPEVEERLAGLALLWSEAKFNFVNFDLVSLNLDSLYLAYIPKVMEVENALEYYKILRSFYSKLNDGHTMVIPPNELWENVYSSPGIIAEKIEDRVILTQILPGIELPEPVAIGDEILKINGLELKDYAAQNIAPFISYSTPQDSTSRTLRFELLSGDKKKDVEVTFQDKKGNIYTSILKRNYIPKMFENGLSIGEYKLLKNNIGYLALNTFNNEEVVSLFESNYEAINKTDGLIIDLRNNGGGNGQNGFEILGQLTEEPFMQATSIYRNYSPTGRAWGNPIQLEGNTHDWKPYKERAYKKPVIVIVGPATYSAAEDFTLAFRQAKRGLIIGEPTGGSTGQPYFFKVPGGGFAAVCTKRDLFNDGTEFVGKGIIPDIEVKRSLNDLRKNKDNVIETARKQLLKENNTTSKL